MSQTIQIISEGEAWEILQIKQKWSTWEITQCNDGDVEISCETDEDTSHLFLDQEKLKQVIEFLQSKLK